MGNADQQRAIDNVKSKILSYATQKEIEIKREGRGTSPVELGKCPNWFRKRLVHRFGMLFQKGDATDGASLVYSTQRYWPECPAVFIDHWGETKIDGRSYFCSEPYMDKNAAGWAAKLLAESLGISWCVETADKSWWYPDVTIRVLFFEGESSRPLEQVRRLVRRYSDDLTKFQIIEREPKKRHK